MNLSEGSLSQKKAGGIIFKNDHTSNDDLLYNHVVQLHDGCDKEILARVEGLDGNLWINVCSSVFN